MARRTNRNQHEQSVVGVAIRSKFRLDLSPEDFDDPTAARVWSAMAKLDSLSWDEVSVCQALRATDDAGIGHDNSVLSWIVHAVSIAAERAISLQSVIEEAKAMRQRSKARRIAAAAARVMDAALTGDGLDAVRIVSGDLHAAASVDDGQLFRTPAQIADAALATPGILIEGLLHRGHNMLVSGPSKMRKSWLCLDLALSVCSGRKWLGLQCAKGPVILVDGEIQAPFLLARIRKVAACKGLSDGDLDNLHVLAMRGREMRTDDIPELVAAKAREVGAALVVLDPAYMVAPGTNENAADEVRDLLHRCGRVSAMSNSALVVVHHFAKGTAGDKSQIDRASGSAVWARWPDVFATLSPHKDAGLAVLEAAPRHMPPFAARTLEWQEATWAQADAAPQVETVETRTKAAPDAKVQRQPSALDAKRQPLIDEVHRRRRTMGKSAAINTAAQDMGISIRTAWRWVGEDDDADPLSQED